MSTKQNIEVRVEELADRAEHLQDKVRASERTLHEVEFDISRCASKDRIHYVLDFNILFSYLFPFLDLKEHGRTQFLFSQFVIDFIFRTEEIRKVIIGPYASEYKRFFEENRRRILESQVDAKSLRALTDFLRDRYYSFRLLSASLESAGKTENEISDILVKQFSMILQNADSKFWSVIDNRTLVSLRDSLGQAEIPRLEPQTYESAAFLRELSRLRPDTPANNRKDASAVLLIDKLNQNFKNALGEAVGFVLITEDNVLVEAMDRTGIVLGASKRPDGAPQTVMASRGLFHFFLMFSFTRSGWTMGSASLAFAEFAKLLGDYTRIVHRIYIDRLRARFENRVPSNELLIEADTLFTKLETALNQIDTAPMFRDGVVRLLSSFETSFDELVGSDPVPDTLEKAIGIVAKRSDRIHLDVERALDEFSKAVRRLEILIAKLGVPKSEKNYGFYYPSSIVDDSPLAAALIEVAEILDRRTPDDTACALEKLLDLSAQPRIHMNANYCALLSKAYRVQSLFDESLDILRLAEESVPEQNSELEFERALTLRSTRPQTTQLLRDALAACLRANDMANGRDPRILRELAFLQFQISELSEEKAGSATKREQMLEALELVKAAQTLLESPEFEQLGQLRSLRAHLHNDIAYLTYKAFESDWDSLKIAYASVNIAVGLLEQLIAEGKYSREETNRVIETHARILMAMWRIRVSLGFVNVKLLSELSQTMARCRQCDPGAKCSQDLERDFPLLFAQMPAGLSIDEIDISDLS